MPNARSFLVAALAAGALAAGCGGDGGGGTPIEQAPEQLARTLCVQLEECAGETLSSLFLPGSCVEQLQRGLEDGELPRWQAAIEQGTVRYDGKELDTCLSELEAMGCEAFSERAFDACDDALEGTVEPGGACSASVECAGANVCRFPDESCPGTCGSRKTEGGSCEEDEECRSGLTCQQGSCTEPAATGEDCGGGVAPDCALPDICVGDDAESETPGTCTPQDEVLVAAEGESCDLEEGPFCRDGLSCAVIDFGSDGAVAECVGPSGSGESCNVAFPSVCPSGEYCDADVSSGDFDGTCVALPGEGEGCLEGILQLRRCAPEHVCVEGTCERIGRIGDECGDDAECYSGHCDGGSCSEPPLCGA